MDAIVDLILIAHNSRLVSTRKKHGFRRAEYFADAVGISTGKLRKIETLKSNPTTEIMARISVVLATPADYLFPPELLFAVENRVLSKRKASLDCHQVQGILLRGEQQALLSNGEMDGVESVVDLESLNKNLQQFMEAVGLNQRQIDIIKLRYGITDEIKLGEISRYSKFSKLSETCRRELPWETPEILERIALPPDEPKTLREVGKQFNLTPERVRQIEIRVLRSLRHPKYSRILKAYLDFDKAYHFKGPQYIAKWNKLNPIGTFVGLINGKDVIEKTYTRSEAWLVGGTPVIKLVGRIGLCELYRVKPLTPGGRIKRQGIKK